MTMPGYIRSTTAEMPATWIWGQVFSGGADQAVIWMMLGLLGGTSAGLAIAPALRVLTWPLLILTAAMLARGWYLEASHGDRWSSLWRRRANIVLTGSTLLSVVLWSLRFTGFLGPRPF